MVEEDRTVDSRELETVAWKDPAVKGEGEQAAFIEGYRVEGLIAQGGCGAVYKALQIVTAQRVAIKILHGALVDSQKMVERFVREVEVVRQLRHPSIVEIFELGELSDGRPYYVMEYLEGMTLNDLLLKEGRLPPDEALRVLEPVCAALAAAHQAGIVHRDVKASNIAVLERARGSRIKLLDFGIAKVLNADGASGLTSVGWPIGTPTVMAPEQILGERLDGRADVYALGVLLYRMLTGQLPFRQGEFHEVARQHLEAPAPRPSATVSVGAAVDAVVLRAMEKRPENRFESVQSFVEALRKAVEGPRSTSAGVEMAGAIPAFGVHLHVFTKTAESELDDDLVVDLGTILDMAETLLQSEGFLITPASGSELIAVRPLSSGTEEERAREQLHLVEVVLSLEQALGQRQDADARAVVSLCVHLDTAVLGATEPPEILGGGIAHTAAWAPPEAGGVYATARLVEQTPGLFVKGELGSLHRLGGHTERRG